MHCSPIASVALLLGHTLCGHLVAQGPSYRQFGSGCAGNGGVPLLTADANSLPLLGSTFRAQISNAPHGPAIGILGLSTTSWAGFSLPLDLDIIGLPGCTLFTDVRRTTMLTIVGGSATWDTLLPRDPAWLGRSFFQQVLVLDSMQPGPGSAMSNAAEGVIGVASPSPLGTIAFPPPSSQTDVDTILVRGSAFDPDGVAEVRVNGELAATSDGYEHWSVRVPLVWGLNLLTVETRDTLGNVDPQAAQARIDFQARMQDAIGIVIDRTRNRALVTDCESGAVIAVDLSTGNRRALSDAKNGDGPMLVQPAGIALDGLRALVVDQYPNSGAVFEVDLVSGDRRLLSDDTHGEGPGFFGPVGIAIDAPRNRALVTDKLKGAVFAVDLANGKRSVLSDANIGAGPSMLSPVGIVIDPAGNRALVTELFFANIIAIDLTTGDRTILSGSSNGSGPNFESPYWITLNGSRALVTDNSGSQFRGRLLAVDLISGDRRVLSDRVTGTGPAFATAHALTMDSTRALVINTGIDAIFVVDTATGDRSVLSDQGNGSGPVFASPRGITLSGTRALITDPELGAVFAMDLATGDRTLIAEGLGQPTGIGLDATRALVIDEQINAVVAVDLTSGNLRTFTGNNVGLGRSLLAPAAIVMAGDRALVADMRAIYSVLLATGTRVTLSAGSSRPSGLALDGDRLLLTETFDGLSGPRILGVDLANGVRTVLSDANTGEGPMFAIPQGIAVDETRALVTDVSYYSDQGRVLAVDLATGDRAVLSDHSTGSGPQLVAPGGIIRVGSFLLVADRIQHAVLAIDTQTGERVILSK